MPDPAPPRAAPRRADVTADIPEGESELGFFDLINPLLRRWRIVVGVPPVAGVGAITGAPPFPPRDRAASTLHPRVQSSATPAPAPRRSAQPPRTAPPPPGPSAP